MCMRGIGFANTVAESRPFEHKVTPRNTEFRMPLEPTDATIQDIYAALVDDAARNELIAVDVASVLQQ